MQNNKLDLNEELARLRRETAHSLKNEPTLAITAGSLPPAWLVEVLGNAGFNLYDVMLVSLSAAGSEPAPVAGQLQAYNIAESFTQTGTLTPGRYAVMWRIGVNNVIQLQP